eukprot:6660168-Pyramimonas_sp.AAC.1
MPRPKIRRTKTTVGCGASSAPALRATVGCASCSSPTRTALVSATPSSRYPRPYRGVSESDERTFVAEFTNMARVIPSRGKNIERGRLSDDLNSLVEDRITNAARGFRPDGRGVAYVSVAHMPSCNMEAPIEQTAVCILARP